MAAVPRPQYSTVVGTAVTALPTRPGGDYSTTLVGRGLYQFGPTHVVAHLTSNPSIPAPGGNTEGVLSVRNLKRPGTLVMIVSGAPSSLENAHETLNYVITHATGVYASGVGQHGAMELHLSAAVGGRHTVTGQFSLVKWNPA